MIAQTVGRVGSICVLGGPSNEPSTPRRPRERRRANAPPSGAWWRQRWQDPNGDSWNAPAVLREL